MAVGADGAESEPGAGRGAHVPLVRSFWLSTKKGKEAWVEPVTDRAGKDFKFVVGTGTPSKTFDPGKGTVSRKGGVCWLSKGPMPFPHIRAEGKAGRMKVRLMAIVTESERGRVYLSPNEEQVRIAERAEPTWRPDAALPDNPRDFKTPNYGMTTFANLFTPRQLVALTTFSDLVMEARARVLEDAKRFQSTGDRLQPSPLSPTTCNLSPNDYADAIATYLGMVVSKATTFHNALARWRAGEGKSAPAFGRQAIPMVWDFAEVNPFAGAGGDFDGVVDGTCRTLVNLPGCAIGIVAQADAATTARARAGVAVCTDPPYYDNIGYADLSDFCYVWLRRSLGSVHPELFRTLLTPKAEELIATPYRHHGSKDKATAFFETGLGRAFEHMRNAAHAGFPLTVFYAFKQSETGEHDGGEDETAATTSASTGWETMLQGLIRAGLSITGTLPMRTEMGTRMVGMGTNSLPTSIVLVCHPCAADASMTTRKDFVAALKKELPTALRDLQSGNIAPVDLAQAAIGPGMATYTRYAKVVNSDGTRMPVRTALQLINQALDEVLSELESEFDSETRWAIKWFEQHAHDEGAFGDAETLSKAMAVSVRGLRDAGFVKDGQGKVRLLRRNELPIRDFGFWIDDREQSKIGNPKSKTTLWSVAQCLILALEQRGETGAAELLRKVGSLGEVARDLAYRLYSTCERKKWAEEARSYNGLVVAWPEIVRLSRERITGDRGQQAELTF